MARGCSLCLFIVPEVKMPLFSKKHGHAEGLARMWHQVVCLWDSKAGWPKLARGLGRLLQLHAPALRLGDSMPQIQEK